MSYQLYNGIFRKKNKMRALPKSYDLDKGVVYTKNSTQQGSISNLTSVSVPSKGTIYFWYRLTEYGALRAPSQVVSLFISGTGAFLTQSRIGVYLAIAAGVPRIWFETRNSGGTVVVTLSIDFSIDFKAHLIVVTYDNTLGTPNITMYYDGVQGAVVNTANIGIPSTFYSPNLIGRDTFANITTGMVVGEDGFINGSVLSSSDVTKLWNSGEGSNINALGSYSYVFRHNYDGDSTDLSGNSRTTTYTGSPTITYSTFS